jgi:hypothetical protein
MRTIGVSCLVKAWIASLRTTFGAKSTGKISTRAIFNIATALTSLTYSLQDQLDGPMWVSSKSRAVGGAIPKAQLGERITRSDRRYLAHVLCVPGFICPSPPKPIDQRLT